MSKCTCGCSIGVHFHTNNLASCAKCGPKKCSKFVAAAVSVPAQSATDSGGNSRRLDAWLSKNGSSPGQ